MDDPVLIARTHILADHIREGDKLIPDLEEGCVYLVRRLPPNYGRLAGYLSDGAVDCPTLPPDVALARLIRLASASPSQSPAVPRRADQPR